MSILLADDRNVDVLDGIQGSISSTDMITGGVYMCDCTGCSNGCFEFCADGAGPTN